MTTTTGSDASPGAPSPTNSTIVRRAGSLLLILAFSALLLGDVLAFNQLATQSPTDAIVQVLVFSIGAAGVIECVRRLVAPTASGTRRSAAIPGLLGVIAIAIWRAQLPVGFAVIVTLAAAVAWGATAFRLLGGATADRDTQAEQLFGLFSFAQTIVLLSIAVLTAIEAGPSLFG